MADQLIVDNFLNEIRKMSNRDRNKIQTELLLDLILQLANTEKDDKYAAIEKRIVALEQGYTYIKQETVSNTASIQNLKSEKLHVHVTEASAENIQKIKEIGLEMNEMKKLSRSS